MIRIAICILAATFAAFASWAASQSWSVGASYPGNPSGSAQSYWTTPTAVTITTTMSGVGAGGGAGYAYDYVNSIYYAFAGAGGDPGQSYYQQTTSYNVPGGTDLQMYRHVSANTTGSWGYVEIVATW